MGRDTMGLDFTYAGLTDIGRVRKLNEDSLALDPDYGLFVVSDGMGGHAAGDVASRTVVENLPLILHKKLGNVTNIDEPVVMERFKQAIIEVSNMVRDKGKNSPGLRGMGATLVSVLVREHRALFAHMGDSRAYISSQGKLRQVTVDHSVVQLLIDSGELNPNDAEKHPARGQITMCMGMKGDPLPDAKVVQMNTGDRILLCSDGLSGFVRHEKIEGIIGEGGDPKEICKSLINAANEGGGKDNITAIVIEIEESKTLTDTQSVQDVSPKTSPKSSMDTRSKTATKYPSEMLKEAVAVILSLDDHGKRFNIPLQKTAFTIGRDKQSDLYIEDSTVSREHCVIVTDGKKFVLVDNNSSNGTYLNGTKLHGSIKLPVPSWFAVGKIRLAIVPPKTEEIESLEESAYTNKDAILIPPTSFFEERTEALLVVDVVGSSSIVRKGDIYLAKIVTILGKMLDRDLKKEPDPFLKCTGDGFLACFSTPVNAFRTALILGPELSKLIDIPIKISIALHFGSARLTAGIERTGQNVHAVFSVEDLRHKQEKVIEHLSTHPEREIILMTKAFWTELPAQFRNKSKYLGAYPLKGLNDPADIYCWCGGD